MDGPLGRAFSKYVEGLAFSGDESWYNPLRYVPKPMHTKLWQERTPRAQYEQQEVYGVRQRRWQKPVHLVRREDFHLEQWAVRPV